MKSLKNIVSKISEVLCRVIWGSISLLLPVKKSVFFYAANHRYRDNLKFISQRLHELRPDVEIIWQKPEDVYEQPPSYVKTIKPNSISTITYSFRAQVVIDYQEGGRHSSANRNNFLKSLLCKILTKKRKDQYSFSTGHGTPLKKLGHDSLETRPNIRFYSNSDFIIAGCEHTKACFESAYSLGIPFKMYGTPRNDILFQAVDTVAFKKKLQIPPDSKVILFAPTFRNSVETSGVMQMKSFDFDKLFVALEERFEGDWRFAFRVHRRVQEAIDTAAIAQRYGDRIIDGNFGEDMAEYIVCTDILLTDYSSCMFDFALTRRPCLLFAPDREHYENEERGMYIDFDSLPFPKAYTSDELVEQIKNFDNDRYVKEVNQFLSDIIGDVEDGHATDRIVDDIIHFIDTGEKR